MRRLLYRELKNKAPELAECLDLITTEALGIWQNQLLRNFTAHGKKHIEQVENNLDVLTASLQRSQRRLNPHEIFVLIAGCYLHDIGMQLGEADAREKHATYAYDLILHSHAQYMGQSRRVTLTINDSNAREAIAVVARGHWLSFALEVNTNEEDETAIYGTHTGRLRLLCLLLSTADLLDLSPERATIFQSAHRLDQSNAASELHNIKHERVKLCAIKRPDAQLPDVLQYQLEWRDDNKDARAISDWVLHEIGAQGRKAFPCLYRASSGHIVWAKDWIKVTFKPQAGPVPNLSDSSRKLLAALRSDQIKINREEYTASFLSAIRLQEQAIFRFSSDASMDAYPLAQWCFYHARFKADEAHVALIYIGNSLGKSYTLSDLIREIMKGWGQNLPPLSDDEALEKLKTFTKNESAKALVSIFVSDIPYNSLFWDPLILCLLQRPNPGRARIVLIMFPDGQGPEEIFTLFPIIWPSSLLTEEDVLSHLEEQWGMSELDGQEAYRRMMDSTLVQYPQDIYNYIKAHVKPTTF